MAAAICVPRSPANLRAYGSRKTASARSLSCARYTATHRAVSEMWRIGVAELMARESYLFSGDEACAQWQLLITGHCTHHPHPTPAPVKVAIRARRAVRPILRHRRPSAMRRKKCKLSYRRTVLRLPDLDHSKLAVLNSLTSPGSRRVYQYATDQFTAWYCSEPRLAFNRIVVVRYRMHLESRGLAANTINQQLAASRSLETMPGRELECPHGGSQYADPIFFCSRGQPSQGGRTEVVKVGAGDRPASLRSCSEPRIAGGDSAGEADGCRGQGALRILGAGAPSDAEPERDRSQVRVSRLKAQVRVRVAAPRRTPH